MKSWQELSKQHIMISFSDYHYALQQDTLQIVFDFQLAPDITFHPTITIDHVPVDRFQSIAKETLDTLIFHLGLIESFSYWKVAAPKTIDIACATLTQEQENWWRSLLVNGMGEYAYQNQVPIGYIETVRFVSGTNHRQQVYQGPLADKSLIPIGGGKDSAVVSDLLGHTESASALLLHPTPAATSIAKLAGFSDPIVSTRFIDPKLLEMNKQGYLNGHTPFSALLGFLSVLCAVLFDYQNVVLANERSANEGNTVYDGQTINHQYSKTFAFEKNFHDYAKQYLANDVNYFSLLRPLYELQIAKLFSALNRQYLVTFRSCNVGQKENKWCGKCPKCLFVFIMMSPFLDKQTVTEIFGHDLFDDQLLLPILKALLGIEGEKPFDCVGTYEEIRSALYLARKQGATGFLIDYFIAEVMGPHYSTIDVDAQRILQSWNEENLVPDKYQEVLKKVFSN